MTTTVTALLCSTGHFISAKWREWMVEILFSFDVCLCVCPTVRACAAALNANTPKRLKLRTSSLTCMFPGTVRTWPLKNFPKRWRCKGHVTPKFKFTLLLCKNSLRGDMHSHERLLVSVCYRKTGRLSQKWTFGNWWSRNFTGQMSSLSPDQQHQDTVGRNQSILHTICFT